MSEKNEKNKHGGERENAGCPLKYGEKLSQVSLPESVVDQLRTLLSLYAEKRKKIKIEVESAEERKIREKVSIKIRQEAEQEALELNSSDIGIKQFLLDKEKILRRKIEKEVKKEVKESDDIQRLQDDALSELDNCWSWIVSRLEADNKVVDMERFRRYDSRVSAGDGREAINEEHHEEISLSGLIKADPVKNSVLVVTGNSMEMEGIYEGTLLVVDETDRDPSTIQDGKIVIATVGNSDRVVKIYMRDDENRLLLVSAAEGHKPIDVEKDYDGKYEIQGTVKTIINDARLIGRDRLSEYIEMNKESL